MDRLCARFTNLPGACVEPSSPAPRAFEARLPLLSQFVEQPLAYDDIEGLRKLARATKVPIGVDEGIHSFADITASVVGHTSGQ